MKSDLTWLDSWNSDLKGKDVLELGCGSGVDTAYMVRFVNSIVAGDLSPPKEILGAVVTIHLDHSKDLPFADSKYDVVVASLSLHYFTLSVTQKIVKEISRTLKTHGLLICRLNSENDYNYAAVGYPEIERGLYMVDGRPKRFFNESSIEALFSPPWKLSMLKETAIDRYEKEKIVWEFGVING